MLDSCLQEKEIDHQENTAEELNSNNKTQGDNDQVVNDIVNEPDPKSENHLVIMPGIKNG